MDRPTVAIGIAEKDEGVPAPALPINQRRALVVPDRTDVHATLDQMSPRRLDVGHVSTDGLVVGPGLQHAAIVALHQDLESARGRRLQVTRRQGANLGIGADAETRAGPAAVQHEKLDRFGGREEAQSLPRCLDPILGEVSRQAKYESADGSGLTLDVKSGNNDYPIDLQ